jgi:hypothetical protein
MADQDLAAQLLDLRQELGQPTLAIAGDALIPRPLGRMPGIAPRRAHVDPHQEPLRLRPRSQGLVLLVAGEHGLAAQDGVAAPLLVRGPLCRAHAAASQAALEPLSRGILRMQADSQQALRDQKVL